MCAAEHETDMVVYMGTDEVLITTVGNEDAMLEEWFENGNRDYFVYDRIVIKSTGVVYIASKMTVDFH